MSEYYIWLKDYIGEGRGGEGVREEETYYLHFLEGGFTNIKFNRDKLRSFCNF